MFLFGVFLISILAGVTVSEDAPDCAACDFSIHVFFGYLPSDTFCNAYYICEISRSAPSGYVWTMMCCPQGLVWNSDIKTCVYPTQGTGKDNVCSQIDVTECPGPQTTEAPECYHQAIEGNPRKYYNTFNGYEYDCAPGTLFSPETCNCGLLDTYQAVCDKLIHFDFNGSYSSDSCNNHVHGYNAKGTLPEIVDDAACFNGIDQYLEFNYLNNFFVNNPTVKTWTYAFWIKPVSVTDVLEGIFQSGCERIGSALIMQNDASVDVYAIHDSVRLHFPEDYKLLVDVWNHIALTFDGKYHRLHLDGVEVFERVSVGDANTMTPSFIGRVYYEYSGVSFYTGCIDDFCFYPRQLSAAEITSELVDPGRSGGEPPVVPP